MNKKISILSFIISCLVFPHWASGADTPGIQKSCFSTAWPHETSNLKPDPRLIFGRLENGFRYVLMENREPRDRVGIYLDVQTGSLNETQDQRGIAHFVEHMVFNGSNHFKPGELIDYFQSRGMSFGGDTNARTGYNETIYNIILPNGTRQEVEKGLLVFSDYARGALLLDKEIDRERGVILSEKRARDSAAYRTMVATSVFSFRGTRMPDRLPIGVSEILEKADRTLLKSYYDTWYRPEDMILVMVGDFDPTLTEPLVKERFASLTGSATQPHCPEFGNLQHSGLEAFYHFEPEMGSTRIAIETLWDEPGKNDSLDRQVRDLKKNLVTAMILHRLEKLAEDPNTPFTDSGYATGEILNHVGYGAISVSTDPEKWEAALQVIEKTLRQALQYGFSEEELQRVKKEALASLDSSVLIAGTRNSLALADEIISNLNKNKVFQSPDQKKNTFGPILQQMSLQEVQDVFASVWAHQNRLVEVSGNVKIASATPEVLIKDIYEGSQKEAVQARAAQAAVDFPYLKPAETEIKPVADIPMTDIGAERLILPNGVILNLKKTDFKKNTVTLRADFGQGKQGEPVPGLAMLTQAVVNGSGSGRLTESELNRVLTGSTVSLSFQASESSFNWEGSAVSADMELLFQVLQTVLVDPGIREDAYRVSMENIRQMYKNLQRDINGGMALHVQRFLAGEYPSAGLPPWEDFSKLTLAQINNWLLPEIAGSPLEISIVGDFDRNQLVALAGRYLGGLAKREIVAKQDAATIHFPAGKQLRVKVDSSIDKAMVVVAWPTADFWDIGRTRRLNMLASIFTDRLRKKVREELGATYSPVVTNSSSRVFPGYGLMQTQIIVEPKMIDLIKDAVIRIGDDLQKRGCTEDELERAKAPILTSLKDMVRTNKYWLDVVLSLSTRHPQQLEWPTTVLGDFQAITSKDIAVLAEKYLVGDRAAIAVVEPGKREKNE
jgi:zinc protease